MLTRRRFSSYSAGCNPFKPSPIPFDTHDFERELIETCGKIYAFPSSIVWGLLSKCGTNSNIHGMYMGRTILIGCTGLSGKLCKNRNHPALMGAATGTTFKSAIAPADPIREALKRQPHFPHPETDNAEIVTCQSPSQPNQLRYGTITCSIVAKPTEFYCFSKPSGSNQLAAGTETMLYTPPIFNKCNPVSPIHSQLAPILYPTRCIQYRRLLNRKIFVGHGAFNNKRANRRLCSCRRDAPRQPCGIGGVYAGLDENIA